MKPLDSRAAVRRAGFQRMIHRTPPRLTLPEPEPPFVDPEETKTPAGCLLGIALMLLTAAVAWVVFISLVWMITAGLL